MALLHACTAITRWKYKTRKKKKKEKEKKRKEKKRNRGKRERENFTGLAATWQNSRHWEYDPTRSSSDSH